MRSCRGTRRPATRHQLNRGIDMPDKTDPYFFIEDEIVRLKFEVKNAKKKATQFNLEAEILDLNKNYLQVALDKQKQADEMINKREKEFMDAI